MAKISTRMVCITMCTLIINAAVSIGVGNQKVLIEPVPTTASTVFGDENAELPVGSELLAELLAFRCECDPDFNPKAILLIHSFPLQEDRRNAIRDTWGSLEQCKRYRVVLKFVMNRPDTVQLARSLKTEMEQNNDILIVNFTRDTGVVRPTTEQTFHAVQWILESCPITPFLVQAADNTFMRLDKLGDITESFLKDVSANSIVGFPIFYSKVIPVYGSASNVRASSIDLEYFPPYCHLAAGFVMPMRMAQRDFSDMPSQINNSIPLIDVHYGLAAENYNWTMIHNEAFSLTRLRNVHDAVKMKSKFTALSPNEIDQTYDIWKKISDERLRPEL